jgi:Rrf2 family protein
MKLSTKSTYGLRAMLAIAMNGASRTTSITDISDKEGISVAYLEQLLNKLRRKGLVGSIRGPKGGYVLSKKTRDITVADIVRTLEGSIYPVHCVSTQDGSAGTCVKGSSCVPKLVWHKLAKAINDCLESVTLEDLCTEAAKINRRRPS